MQKNLLTRGFTKVQNILKQKQKNCEEKLKKYLEKKKVQRTWKLNSVEILVRA